MTQYLQEPLNSPSAWRGRDLAGRDDWILHLERSHVEELETALAAVAERGLDPVQITATDFPLPTLSSLCCQMRSELEGGRGFVVLRALPVQRFATAEITRMFWGLGTHLGSAEPQDGAGNLLHHVRDTGMDLDKHDVRAYQTNRAIGYHNDGADVFLLLCVQAARHGQDQRHGHICGVIGQHAGRVGDGDAALDRAFNIQIVDACAELGNVAQLAPGLGQEAGIDCIGHRRHQNVRAFHRIDETGLIEGRIGFVELGVEKLFQANLYRVRQSPRHDYL